MSSICPYRVQIRQFLIPTENFADSKNTLIYNPFMSNVEDFPTDDYTIQQEFIDLINNGVLQSQLENKCISQFWISLADMFPILLRWLRLIMPFPTTYACESAFSTLVCIKIKLRNRLSVEHDMTIQQYLHKFKAYDGGSVDYLCQEHREELFFQKIENHWSRSIGDHCKQV